MKFIKHDDWPEPLYKVLTRDFPPRLEGYRVTELQNPPRIVFLRRRHWVDMESDPADRVWMVSGTLFHGKVDDCDSDEGFSEESFKKSIEGVTVSGRADYFDAKRGVLFDYKFASTYSHGEVKPEYCAQLNIYAVFFREAGFAVNAVKLCNIYRDWSRTKAKIDPGYPQQQIHIQAVDLWADGMARQYLSDRVKLMESVKNFTDDNLPECTPLERWASPLTFACVKKAGARSAKNFVADFMRGEDETRQQAEAFAKEKGLQVERRPQEYRRCGMCEAKMFCSQAKREGL